MSAEWVTVPDGKRQHVGIRIHNEWFPMCGRRPGWLQRWMPVRIGRSLRSKSGVCSNCMRVADALYFLIVDSR